MWDKFSCVVAIVAACSYSEISTCGRPQDSKTWPQPCDCVLDLDLKSFGLDVLASFNISGIYTRNSSSVQLATANRLRVSFPLRQTV